MLKLTLNRDYKAAIYLRLSKEDGDSSFSGEKLESDSISNQRLLILEYLKKCPEITVVREYCDDGYTGANFERPHFQEMMDAVKAGEIDCIVVKDLSRFGREYIESGNYLQKIFPTLGVRFIAINDNYDNARPGAADNDLVLPFKNLMNDSYCRDISIKIRTNLDAKRRSGQFVNSQVVYGYIRDPNNKNRLVVDREAAAVVQDIFKWKLEGMSPSRIADRLNEIGVLSPIEYKRAKGGKQRTAFQTKPQALWSAVAIYRILKNEIYTGTLVQGKTTTPNHKIKKRMVKDPSEWARTEHAHEPIISAAQFDLVREVMLEDTRCPAGSDYVHLFSGKVFCARCESPMVRTVKYYGKKDKPYAYFVCATHNTKKDLCATPKIREQVVYDTVLAVIQAHISAALNMHDALKCIEGADWEARELKKIEGKIAFQQEVIDKNRRLSTGAYEDFHAQIISREEYETFRKRFNDNIAEALAAISQLTGERNSIKEGLADQQGWLAQFKQYKNIRRITRSVVVSLIDRIYIRDNGDMDIRLKHRDRFAAIVEFLKEQEAKKQKVGEAV